MGIGRGCAAVAAGLLFVGMSACSEGDDDGDGSASTATTTTTAAPPEQFTGSVDDFYRVPDPLPEGAPGQLIRVQEVESGGESTTIRVMYHSQDASERDRAVTGIITYPTAPAPEGGWPVVSWAHGTTGVVSKCAPSRTGGAAPAFGVEGVAVATDYVGLGPVGEIHPYLSKPSEGNAVIDAVRAARNLPEAHASTRWVAIGHSQGGHGALAAAELAADHASELDLIGTVALAPGSDLDKTFGPADEVVARVVGALALYSAPSEHPEIDPDDYAGPGLQAVAGMILEECLDAISIPLAAIPAEDFYAHDPVDTEPARSLVRANDVGDVAVDAPLLLVSGTADTTVAIDRVRMLFGRLCDAGQVTELVVVDGADHGNIIPRTEAQVTEWLTTRFADGTPPVDSCPP